MTDKIENVSSFLAALRPHRQRLASDRELLFRGQPDVNFDLVPSLFRDPGIHVAENEMLSQLVAAHPQEFAADQTALGLLARAQHYALPTRLLDITRNPLVALFFACYSENEEIEPTDGEVVILSLRRRIIKSASSDTVSCIANLAHLSSDEKKYIEELIVGKCDEEDFNEEIGRLIHFIRMEKSFFRPEIVPRHLRRVLCVRPKMDDRRLLAQSGAFLLFGLRMELKKRERARGISVNTICVKESAKLTILEELNDLSISKNSLFPSIEETARYIKSRFAQQLDDT